MFNWYEGTNSPPLPVLPWVGKIHDVGSGVLVACVDIGHSAMANTGGESPGKMIRALGGKRVKALHVHDNDLVRDVHTLPFTRKIDWDEVMTALKDIGYDGELTFEADTFLSQFPDELAVHASRLMLEVGRYFVSKYNL